MAGLIGVSGLAVAGCRACFGFDSLGGLCSNGRWRGVRAVAITSPPPPKVDI